MINTASIRANNLKINKEFNASDRIGLGLLEQSVYFLSGDITEESINECIKWITYENLIALPKANKILTLYINSQGGELYQAFALIDIIKSSKLKIRTIGIGQVMSAGFLIFVSGTKGERYIAKNTGIMCHQLSTGFEDKYHDVKAAMKENDYCASRMVDILRDATGKGVSIIKNKLLPPTDVWMTAEELIEFGAADHLLK